MSPGGRNFQQFEHRLLKVCRKFVENRHPIVENGVGSGRIVEKCPGLSTIFEQVFNILSTIGLAVFLMKRGVFNNFNSPTINHYEILIL